MPHTRVPKNHPEPTPAKTGESPIRTPTDADTGDRPADRRNEAELKRAIEASTQRLEELARTPVPVEEEIEIA